MQHYHFYQGPFSIKPRREIAWESLPIPYRLTDLAREFLVRLSVEEVAGEANVANPESDDIRTQVDAIDDLASVQNVSASWQ